RWAIEQHCSCGRHMPILEAIEGRHEDMCYTYDGRQMLRFDTVFKGIKHIREAQVVQEKLDLFRVYLVPSEGFNKHDVEKIQNNMRLHVGNVHTDVRPVEVIPRSPSGKFRAVICNLSPQEKRSVREAKQPSSLNGNSSIDLGKVSSR